MIRGDIYFSNLEQPAYLALGLQPVCMWAVACC